MKNTYMRDIKQEDECVNECVYVYPKAKNPSVISTDLSMFSNFANLFCLLSVKELFKLTSSAPGHSQAGSTQVQHRFQLSGSPGAWSLLL